MTKWYEVEPTGNATTNPDPNTLTTKNPGETAGTKKLAVSSAWATQDNKAIFPLLTKDKGGEDRRVTLAFIPSAGEAVTYTVNIWFHVGNNRWIQATENTPSADLTGSSIVYVENPDYPIFVQLSNISSGTINIEVDAATAQTA